MKLSSLYKQCHHFEKPTYTITIDSKKWKYKDEFEICDMSIQLSNSLLANMTSLHITNIQERRQLDALQSGSEIEIAIGYKNEEQIVFMGYIHRIIFHEIAQHRLSYVEIEAMDVKGLMMLCKRSSYEYKKKRSSIVREILQSQLYKTYVGSLQIDKIPSALDYAMFMDSKSDYDVLSQVAIDLNFEFFVKGNKLYFQEAYKKQTGICFDTWDGVTEIQQETNLDDLFTNVEVISCLGLEKRQSVKAKVSLSKFPQTKKIDRILKEATLTVVSEEYQSMEEMKAYCSIYEQQIQNQYASMSGKCAWLPHLACSEIITIQNVMDEKEKKVYLHEVSHEMHHGMFYTSWNGSLLKG